MNVDVCTAHGGGLEQTVGRRALFRDQLVSFLQLMSREQSCLEALTLHQGCPSLLSLCSHHITSHPK